MSWSLRDCAAAVGTSPVSPGLDNASTVISSEFSLHVAAGEPLALVDAPTTGSGIRIQLDKNQLQIQLKHTYHSRMPGQQQGLCSSGSTFWTLHNLPSTRGPSQRRHPRLRCREPTAVTQLTCKLVQLTHHLLAILGPGPLSSIAPTARGADQPIEVANSELQLKAGCDGAPPRICQASSSAFSAPSSSLCALPFKPLRFCLISFHSFSSSCLRCPCPSNPARALSWLLAISNIFPSSFLIVQLVFLFVHLSLPPWQKRGNSLQASSQSMTTAIACRKPPQGPLQPKPPSQDCPIGAKVYEH